MSATPESPDLSPTLSDLEAAQAGDRLAANRLWERYSEKLIPAVRARLGKRLRQKLETEDILQSVFLEAVRSAEHREFASDGQFRAWLIRLIENRIRKKATFFSRQRRDSSLEKGLSGTRDEPAADWDRPLSVVAARDQEARVKAAMERLPDGSREALNLRFFQGCSFAEIGGRLERSEEAARKLVERAVRLLSQELGA